MLKRLALPLTALLALGGVAGCTGGGGKLVDGKVNVVAAFYPLQYVAERVGGDHVRVTNLVKPGAEPHDVELSAQDVAKVSDAGLVVYLPGFQPAVDGAVKGKNKDTVVDVSAGITLLDLAEEAGETDNHGAKDPHIWLDPTRLRTVGDKLAERLATADPDHAADYRARAAELDADLTALDKKYVDGLRNCQRRELVTGHAAFGYLANHYDLKQVSIAGLSPDQEPSAQRIAEIIQAAKQNKATTIFSEAKVSVATAKTIADGAGARTEVLDALESVTPGSGADYLTIMRANLAKIRTALGCS